MTDGQPEDEDVLAEQAAARAALGRHGEAGDAAMVVQDMVKRFGNFTAVKGLSFTIKQGEDL